MITLNFALRSTYCLENILRSSLVASLANVIQLDKELQEEIFFVTNK